MSIISDIKYASLLGSRLPRFKIISHSPFKAQFRCPICGDSQKSEWKARGFLIQNQQSLGFYCHNHSKGLPFYLFLKEKFPDLYKDYIFETYRKTDLIIPEEPIKQPIETSALDELKSIAELRKNHPARKYVEQRLIPEDRWTDLFYCPKFVEWTNSIIPDKLQTKYESPRLILPMLDKAGRMFGYQGRSFDPDADMRYITVMLDPNKKKVFGLNRFTRNKHAYICEGILDACFLINCLAAVQGDLSICDEFVNIDRTTWIPDKDIRNKEVMAGVKKLIKAGKAVCLLPRELSGKDINQIVLNDGCSPAEVKNLIDKHTYRGPRLMLEFSQWSKV